MTAGPVRPSDSSRRSGRRSPALAPPRDERAADSRGQDQSTPKCRLLNRVDDGWFHHRVDGHRRAVSCGGRARHRYIASDAGNGEAILNDREHDNRCNGAEHNGTAHKPDYMVPLRGPRLAFLVESGFSRIVRTRVRLKADLKTGRSSPCIFAT